MTTRDVKGLRPCGHSTLMTIQQQTCDISQYTVNKKK